MKEERPDQTRRTLVKTVVATAALVPLGGLAIRGARAEEMPRLSEDDPAAKALQYVHDAGASDNPKRKPDQFCKNCNLIRSESGTWRPCQLFPGKAVNENGWCVGWVLKA
jgi:hypothetical protein